MGRGTNQENGRPWQTRKSLQQGYCWPWHFASEMEQGQVWHLVEGARLLLQLKVCWWTPSHQTSAPVPGYRAGVQRNQQLRPLRLDRAGRD